MKHKLALGALIAVLGTSAAIVPFALTAQEAQTPDAAPDASADGPMGGPADAPMGGRPPIFDFAKMDTDKDGKITQEELKAFRAAQVSGVDADKNGLISESELAADIVAKMTARADDMAKARIAAQDVDGDGQLSAEELLAPPLPAALFGRIDGDGDGAISQAEFDAAREKMAERKGDARGDRKGHGRGMRFWGGPDNG